MNNEIGFAGHSTQQATIENNILYQNTLAGITLVNSDNGVLTLNLLLNLEMVFMTIKVTIIMLTLTMFF